MTDAPRFGILVAVDDSEAAGRTLNYVAQVVGQRERFRVHLLHLLPPLPPGVLEHPGAEDPSEEARLDRELAAKRERALERQREEAQPLLGRARSILEGAGFARDAITTEFCSTVGRPSVARACLESADEHRCGTIALGRDLLPKGRELLHQHAAEELVKHGARHTIWVVG